MREAEFFSRPYLAVFLYVLVQTINTKNEVIHAHYVINKVINLYSLILLISTKV